MRWKVTDLGDREIILDYHGSLIEFQESSKVENLSWLVREEKKKDKKFRV